jgi:hypothetical protein
MRLNIPYSKCLGPEVFQILFLLFFFKLGYIHFTGGGGFIVTILIRLILCISYTAPIVSPPKLPPCPTESNCKRFLSSVSCFCLPRWFQIPGLKESSCLSHPSNCDYRYMPPGPAQILDFSRFWNICINLDS